METFTDPSPGVPLISTTRGHLPIAECEHFVQWTRNENAVVFNEIWRYRGEEVRRDAHIFMLRGLELGAAQASIGG